MDIKGAIRAVNSVLLGSQIQESPGCDRSRAERFAIKRFYSKLEHPDSGRSEERRQVAWEDWLRLDNTLQANPGLYRPNWAQAKIWIAKCLKNFRLGPVSFSNGSEFTPTDGFNSVESKLSRSEWTCTSENFDLWLDTVYSTRALKMATRKRFASLLATAHIDGKAFDRFMWNRYSKYKDSAKRIFGFKLFLCTTFVQGNRFSTVPKNNLKDRPICIEPLANILTQRRIGIGLRSSLLDVGIDIRHTADLHRMMIGASKYATVDLKNASDRISIHLIRYLLPKRVFDLIEQARSEMTLGLDGEFYFIKKISSMGNGFTFELMSLILTALCKSYTSDTSVFGDDIIIPNAHVSELLLDLENGQFIVNGDKTFINSDYRESCGAHFLDGHGYVESYDFKWLENVGELITCINKLSRLALIYPSFRNLYCEVYRATPAILYAENPCKATGSWHRQQEPWGSPKLDVTTVLSPFQFRKDGLPMKYQARKKIRRYCEIYHLNPKNASLHYGYEWKDSRPAPSIVNATHDWAKILMYLRSGRKCSDTIKGHGAFKSFLAVTLYDGSTLRWTDICKAIE